MFWKDRERIYRLENEVRGRDLLSGQLIRKLEIEVDELRSLIRCLLPKAVFEEDFQKLLEFLNLEIVEGRRIQKREKQ